MYVCVCFAITDKDLEEAIREGANSLRSLQRATQIGKKCGSCLCVASEALAAATPSCREPCVGGCARAQRGKYPRTDEAVGLATGESAAPSSSRSRLP